MLDDQLHCLNVFNHMLYYSPSDRSVGCNGIAALFRTKQPDRIRQQILLDWAYCAARRTARSVLTLSSTRIKAALIQTLAVVVSLDHHLFAHLIQTAAQGRADSLFERG